MTTTTQAPSSVPGSTAHTDGAWAPDPDPFGATALVRPRRLRSAHRPRGQLEAHARRPDRTAVRGRGGRRRMPSPSRSAAPERVEIAAPARRRGAPRRRVRPRGSDRGDRVAALGRGAARPRIPAERRTRRAGRRRVAGPRRTRPRAPHPRGRGERARHGRAAPPRRRSQFAENVEIIVGDGAHLTVDHGAAVGR